VLWHSQSLHCDVLKCVPRENTTEWFPVHILVIGRWLAVERLVSAYVTLLQAPAWSLKVAGTESHADADVCRNSRRIPLSVRKKSAALVVTGKHTEQRILSIDVKYATPTYAYSPFAVWCDPFFQWSKVCSFWKGILLGRLSFSCFSCLISIFEMHYQIFVEGASFFILKLII